MNHYDALLAELRTVDKKMLRRLDRKRHPPEPMPDQIWYGSDIPRDKLDRFLQVGGYAHVEGTPMVLAIYNRYKTNFCAVLLTTVGMYATESDFELSGRRFRWVKPEFPIRYADYTQICGKRDRYGFYDYHIDLFLKDGTKDALHTLHTPVFTSCTLNRCVDYVNKHGPVEKDPPLVRTQAEDDLQQIMDRYFPGPIQSVFPQHSTLTPPALPEPVQEQQPQPIGSGVYPKKANAKMDEFRRYARKNEPEKALNCLKEAVELGHGDAAWVLGKIIEKEDYHAAVELYIQAAQAGSKDGALSNETFCIAMAHVSLTQLHDLQKWEEMLTAAANMGGTDALLMMGQGYLSGLEGVPKNRELGLHCLKLAAQRGSSDAMFRLGMELFLHDAPERKQAGKAWIEEAARNGRLDAMLILLLPTELKTMDDWKKAYNWGRQAYAAVQIPKEKALVAKAMQLLTATAKDYALWRSIEQRYTED